MENQAQQTQQILMELNKVNKSKEIAEALCLRLDSENAELRNIINNLQKQVEELNQTIKNLTEENQKIKEEVLKQSLEIEDITLELVKNNIANDSTIEKLEVIDGKE